MVNPSKTANNNTVSLSPAELMEFWDKKKPSGKYVYVIARDGSIALYPWVSDAVHDISLLDKSEVLVAGTLKIEQGKIYELNNLYGAHASSIQKLRGGLRKIPKKAFAPEAQILVYVSKKSHAKNGENSKQEANLLQMELPAYAYYECRDILDAIKGSINDIRNNVLRVPVSPSIFKAQKSFARRALLHHAIQEIDAIMEDKTLSNQSKKEHLTRLHAGLAIQLAPVLAGKTFFWGLFRSTSPIQKTLDMHINQAQNTLHDAEFGRKGRFISSENDFIPSRSTDQTFNWIISRFLPGFIRKFLFKTDTDQYREEPTEAYSTLSTLEIQSLAPPFESAEELSEDELREYARQVRICNVSTSSVGNLTAKKTTNVFMENIVSINGHYNTHAQMPVEVQEHLSTLSEEAYAFFESHFPPELSRQLIENNGAIIDKNTGLVANILYEKNSQGKPSIHIVFGGTGSAGFQAQHMATDASIFFNPGFIPASFTQARDLVGLVKKISGDDAQVEVKGFSLGGAVAAYAGLSHQLKTVCLSPMPMPAILWRDLANRYGRSLRHLVQNHLVNLTVEGDLATHWKLEKLGHALESTFFDLPHILGKTYVLKRQSLPNDEDMIDDLSGYGVHHNAALLWSKLLLKRMPKQASATSARALEQQKENFLRGKVSDIKKTEALKVASSTSSLFFERKNATQRINAFRQGIMEFNAAASVKKGISLFSNGKKLIGEIKVKTRYLQRHYNELTQEQKSTALEELLKIIELERTYNPVSLYVKELAELYSRVVNEYIAINPGAAKSRMVNKAAEEEKDTVFATVQAAVERSSDLKMIEHPNSQENYLVNLPLATGDEIWPATYEIIMKAQKSVKLTTYLFYEGSESAKWIYKALYDLQKKQQECLARGEVIEPIRIEFVIDDSHGPIRQKNKRGVTEANPISNYGIGCPFSLDPQLIDLTVYGMRHYKRGSLHEKLVTVDEEYAVVSTCNIKNVHHAAGSEGKPRFDGGIIMKGGIAKSFNEGIEYQKLHSNTEVLGTNALEKNRTSAPYPEQFMPFPYDEKNRIRIEEIKQALQGELELIGPFDAVAIAKACDNSIFSDKPKSSPQGYAILSALNQAKRCIKISHTNLNIPEVLDALVAAASRGVQVQIIVPPEVMDAESALDAKSNYQAYQYINEKVRALGKEQFIDLRFEGRNGHMIFEGISKQSHCKYMNIDDVAFFGSMNLDIQSWKYSSEVSVALKQEKAVQLLDQHYFYFLFDQAVPYKNYERQEIKTVTEEATQPPSDEMQQSLKFSVSKMSFFSSAKDFINANDAKPAEGQMAQLQDDEYSQSNTPSPLDKS